MPAGQLRVMVTKVVWPPLKTDDTQPIASFCDPSPTWPRDFEEDFSGAKLNTGALVGHLSTSLAHLANISTRVGRSLVFDPQTEQVVGDPEANALVRREYRDHWGTPQGV